MPRWKKRKKGSNKLEKFTKSPPPPEVFVETTIAFAYPLPSLLNVDQMQWNCSIDPGGRGVNYCLLSI